MFNTAPLQAWNTHTHHTHKPQTQTEYTTKSLLRVEQISQTNKKTVGLLSKERKMSHFQGSHYFSAEREIASDGDLWD